MIVKDIIDILDGEVICEGRSEHVFVTREGRIVRVKRDMPEFSAAIEALAAGG